MSSSYAAGQFRIQSRPPSLAQRRWGVIGDPREAVEAATAAVRRGDLEAASAIAENAVRDGAEHPLLLNLGALALERAEAFTEALAWLRRAVQIAPKDTAARNALGLCLQNLGQPEAALAEFDAALALTPDLAPAHCNRGFVLAAMGELKAAEASHRRALELAPGHLGALVGLASLADRFGDHAEARRLAAEVLAAEPGYPPAVMILAAAEAALGAPGAAETRLRALLADPNPEPLHRAFGLGRLGDVLDVLDRTADAFEAYAAAGAGLRRLHAPRFASRSGALETAETLASHLERMPQRAWRSARHIASRSGGPAVHVFVLGFARSATTLLEQALAGHEQVRVLSERETLLDATAEFLGDPEGLERLMAADEPDLEPFREAYWRRVREAGVNPSGAVLVDKHPFNSLRLPLIARLFPEARILFAVRDPRDVVLSCLRRRFEINPITFELLTLEGCARLYSAAMRISSRTNELTRLRLRLVKHEQLATDFDGEIARVCEFLGVRPTAAMADFAGRIRERGVNTPSAAQLARGLDASAVGQWRRYAAHLEPVAPILAPWIERFGYADAPAGRRPQADDPGGSGPRSGRVTGWLGGRVGRSSRI